jgi:hypothetical protein
MVDSRQKKTMANGPQDLPGRVQRVEQKLDALSASVAAGFQHVDAAMLDQREYTEFAYEKLDAKVDAGFSRLDRKMDAGFSRLDQKVDAGFSRLDQRIDAALAQVDGRFAGLERKFDGRFAGLERKIDGRFAGLERKIDQIVNVHLPQTPPDPSDSE